jgi:hypothetical protein
MGITTIIITRIVSKFFSFLLLWGCAASPHWQVSHQKGSQTQFDSARLSYPTRDRVSGVAVEMIYARNKLRTYLEVHSQTIPPHLGNPKEAAVKLKTPHETICGIAHRHQGGQRLTLPAHLQEILIHHLMEGSAVTIQLAGYSTTLDPQDFALSYRKVQKAPLNIPIQLPFKL